MRDPRDFERSMQAMTTVLVDLLRDYDRRIDDLEARIEDLEQIEDAPQPPTK